MTISQPAEIKRVTVKVHGRILHAMDANAVLERAGVDCKLVRKYAVQIHPDHVDRAMAALKNEEAKRALEPWPTAAAADE